MPAVEAPARAATVFPPPRLAGEPIVPGDKSISHRALMLAALAEGESRIVGASDGHDVLSTAAVARGLGASVDELRLDGQNMTFRVVSPGVEGLTARGRVLDCGNSGTSMRLLAGMLAGVPGDAVLDGDASLRSRPMGRVIDPLRAMGAEIGGVDLPDRAPLRVVGRSPLQSIDWTTPMPSAQVKSAILLAGLRAAGTTIVRESVPTRDHTERMLRARGVDVRTTATDSGGAAIEIDGGARVRAIDEDVPGDPSSAAFWLVAGAIHPFAEIRLRGICANPTRRAIIDLLGRMGASIEEAPQSREPQGEPVADLIVRSSELRSTDMEPAEAAAAIDEIPVLCLAATQAHGRTVIRGVGELRHKESDRVAGIVTGLRALGARIDAIGDDFVIEGPTTLRGSVVDSLGDHRLALTFAIAGLVATGATTILEADCVAISYTTFFAELERIQS
jgi:3-phosphoshikimate 1-carboxyvinyltransferase